MANLERIDITPMTPTREGNHLSWHPSGKPLLKVPQVFFSDGEPWRAANSFGVSKLLDSQNDLKTAVSAMGHLKAYADWLEANQADWKHFPLKKRDRVLVRFRGFLIDERDAGRLAPSTTTTRMATVVKFYRWAMAHGWLERQDYWEEKTKVIRFRSTEGLARTVAAKSTDLSIRNTQRNRLTLEGGLQPTTSENLRILLGWLKKNNTEMWLMALLGFFTGARSETIRTLRTNDLMTAYDDPMKPGIKCINVGPGTTVKTKYSVSGHIMVPTPLFDALKAYAVSVRRLRREAHASKADKTILFLTNQGASAYSETSFTKVWSDLREKMVKTGLSQFKYFKFHQTRATYGTQLMTMAMKVLGSNIDAIVFVRDAMLHKHESTTWRYIKFIEQSAAKERFSEEFTAMFFGTGSVEGVLPRYCGHF